MIGLWGEETLNLRTMSRNYEVRVAPFGGQDAAPFFVAGTLSFKWKALSQCKTVAVVGSEARRGRRPRSKRVLS